MFQRSSSFLLLILMVFFCPCISAIAQEIAVAQLTNLDAVDARRCFFAGEKAKLVYEYSVDGEKGERPVAWNVAWTLMADDRTLQKGTSQATALNGSNPLQYAVEIPMPTLRDGISFPIQLSMTWRWGKREHQQTRVIHLFAREAFTHHQKLMGTGKITLFDPERQTAELLEHQEVPFSRINNLSGLDQVSDGILLVGEGVSFQEQRQLGQSLVQAARRGACVICLAPANGSFPCPANEEDLAAKPQRFLLERENFVLRYDKRFDILRCDCQLELATGGEGLLNITNNQNHWAWLDVEYPSVKPEKLPGHLMFCGLGLVSKWNESPVPRYLFVKIIEEFAQQNGEKK